MKDNLKPFMKDATTTPPNIDEDAMDAALKSSALYNKAFSKLNPDLIAGAQRAAQEEAERRSNPSEFSKLVEKAKSLEEQGLDLATLMAESDQRKAEASGRYLADFLDERLKEHEARAKQSEKKAVWTAVGSSLLGAIVGAVLGAVLTYFISR